MKFIQIVQLLLPLTRLLPLRICTIIVFLELIPLTSKALASLAKQAKLYALASLIGQA